MKSTPLKRKKPMSKVSKKRLTDMRIYAKKRKEFLAKNLKCQAHLKILGAINYNNRYLNYIPRSTEVHHVSKRGKYYLDESTWLAVSPWAHGWIHANPKQARELGLLK